MPAATDTGQRDTAFARLARALDPIAVWSGRLVAWLIIPMVIALTYEVVARYVFNAPTLWAYDMTFMMYGSFFMLGAAFTLQRRGHIRTDMIYGGLSPRRQAAVDAVCYVLMFLPFVAVFLWFGAGYFMKAWTTGERFVSSPWMPVTWPFKLAMPASGLLLAIQGVSELCKCLHTLVTGHWPRDTHLQAEVQA